MTPIVHALTPDAPPLDLCRHVKTGGIYLVHTRAALLESTKTPVVVYQSLETGQVWVRAREVFEDGRFERIEP